MELQDIRLDPAAETYRRNELRDLREWVTANADLEPPTTLEIGSNRGRFLSELAQLNPDESLLGFEWQRKWARLANKSLVKAGISNARVLSADANLALPLIYPDATIARVFILFPDPWWKRRHAKRRLFTPAFLQLLAAKIRGDGLLLIKTDVEPYAEYLEALLSTIPQFQLLSDGDPFYPEDETQWPRTTRERKIISEGLPVWKFYLRRTGLVALPPEEQETPEPSRFLKP